MTRKMKDSGIEWIGEIPEDWEISKFKNSSNLYVGDSIKDNEKDNYLDKDDAKAYVATKDLIIDENMVDFSNTLYVKNDNIKFKTAPKDSSLICIEGGSAGRKKAFLDRDVCFVNKLCCINPLNSMDKKYMFYLISNQAFEQEFDKYIQGLIGGVSINKLSNFNIPLPTLKEQHKISSFLDNEVNKINISIGYIYEQIENLKNYKKSVITEAVTKGLDKNVEMKDSEIEWIGEIPKHWKINKIGRICNVITDFVASGSFASIAKNVTYLDKEDYAMLVRTVDLSNKRENVNRIYINKSSYEFLRNSNLIGGEIVLPNIGASIGDVYIVPELYKRMSLAPNSIMIKTKYVDKYYYYCFFSKYGKILLQNLSISSAQPKFNKTELRNIKMMQPPKEEQEQIVRYLDKKTKLIDDSIAIKQKQLETLEEYKKSLIYEYVTGKKEVKDGEES